MAEQITLASLANLENETTACAAINNNSSIITTAFQDCLSLSGVSPNQMNTPLDMNSFPIINLPAPGGPNSPARLVDVTTTNPITISLALSGDVTAPASSSVLTTTVGKVNGVAYPTSPSTNTVPVVTGANTIAYQQVNTAQIANNTVTNTNIRQSSGLSIIGNTTNATANVADITGTTRQVLAVNTAGTSLVFAQPLGDQLLGTTTNSNATAGNVGEYISSQVLIGSAVALTTGVATNVTSISLTAGDWDLTGNVWFNPSTTSNTGFVGWISTTSATQPTAPNNGGMGQINSVTGTLSVTAVSFSMRLSLSTTTTVFLGALSVFSAGTNAAYGFIGARRAR